MRNPDRLPHPLLQAFAMVAFICLLIVCYAMKPDPVGEAHSPDFHISQGAER